MISLQFQLDDTLFCLKQQRTSSVSNDQRIKDTIFRTEDLVGILSHVELDGRVLLVEEMRRQP